MSNRENETIKKSLLIYVNSMQPYGGIERVIANLSKTFKENYDVTILVKDEPKSAYKLDDGILLKSIDCPLVMDMDSRFKRVVQVLLNILFSTVRLRNFLKKSRFDIIYTAFPVNTFEAYVASKNHRKKIVASEHASFFAYNKVYRIMQKLIYPSLSAISVPTKMDTEIYKSLGYRAIYIPHLATFDNYSYSHKTSKLIINVGRLTSDKQQLMLLKIWKKVNDRIPYLDWQLKIIGSGEEGDNLLKYIKENELNNVEIIPNTPNISHFYNTAELFVFTSKMEGFGMVLLEAMSFGVPCISFDCPSGPRDIIKNNENGFLVPCYNEDLFIDKICEYIKYSKNEKTKLQESAFKTVLDWDNPKILNKWNKLFSELENET